MDVKIQTDGYLKNLKEQIEKEQAIRKTGKKVKTWYIETNGGRQYHASFDSLKALVLNEAKFYEADVDHYVKYGSEMIPEREVALWVDGKFFRNWNSA